MTYIEKFQELYPDVTDLDRVVCETCPEDHGIEGVQECVNSCSECWTRQMEGQP